MMNSQRSDVEKINFIEEGKKRKEKRKQASMKLLNAIKLLITV